MKAGFEKPSFAGSKNTSAVKYRNLRNLPHWHIEYELVFVLEGIAELMVNNSFFEMHKGSYAFVGSEDIHYIKTIPGSVVGVIKTEAPYVKKIAGNKHLSSPVMDDFENAAEAFEKVYLELKSEKEYCDIVAELSVSEFVAEVFRQNDTSIISRNSEQMTARYKGLAEMLSKEFYHITFEEAASYVSLNRSYFSKFFYRFSGMTFTQYINTLKVSEAIEKIKEKKMNMTEISISCGFGTIRNFNRVFKSLTGYSPKSLPSNYAYIYNFKDTDEKSFDPTLNCTEIIL